VEREAQQPPKTKGVGQNKGVEKKKVQAPQALQRCVLVLLREAAKWTQPNIVIFVADIFGPQKAPAPIKNDF